MIERLDFLIRKKFKNQPDYAQQLICKETPRAKTGFAHSLRDNLYEKLIE
jgi:hypothetical protein